MNKLKLFEIVDIITGAEQIRENPRVPTPKRVRIGLALVRFGVRLLRKVL